MAKKFYIDQDAGLFVIGPTDSSALAPVTWKNKDVYTLELYFLRQTGIFGRPFSFENRSTATISVGLGLLSASAVASTATFTSLPTVVTATVTVVTGGTSIASEVQKISFSSKPSGGVWAINVPADSRTITSAVTTGIFITTAYHGFVINEPVIFSTLTATGITMGNTYYVYDMQAPDRFRISTTISGTLMSTVTASAGSGTVATPARSTALLNSYAEASDVQSSLRALDTISAAGVEVKGVSGESFYITATGTRQNSDFPLMTVTDSQLIAPYGRTASINLSVAGLQTLLDAETDDAVELVLEVEVNDTGGIKETYSTKVTAVEDLI
jgi:hypothetical protein